MAESILIRSSGKTGDCIAMVHGMSQDHRVFDKQVEAFSDAYDILLIDLPGHGVASEVRGPFGHVEFTRHVEAVLEENGVGPVQFWGTHTGATVGLLLAARRPDLVRSLILEGPVVPGRNPPVVTELVAKARTTFAEGGLSAARNTWWEKGVWFDYMRAHPAECRAAEQRQIVDAFGGGPWSDRSEPQKVTDVEQQLSAIGVPALIYNGEFDHPEFLAAAETIAALLSDADRLLIPDAGGFPAWERPDFVNGAVRSFLARL